MLSKVASVIEISVPYTEMTSHFQYLFVLRVISLRFLKLCLIAVFYHLWLAWVMKIFVYLLIVYSFVVRAELCDQNSKIGSVLKGSKCQVTLDQLHPTQFTVGFLAIEDKKNRIESLANDGEELEKYLAKKDAPAIIGPDRKFHIIDRHHTTYGLLRSNVEASRKLVTVKIIDDFSKRTFTEFYQYMKKNKFVYLYKKGVGPLDPSLLPKSLEEMVDDPYRSLAWSVREEGGFSKEDIPFLEFYWADFFRNKIHLSDSSMRSINIVLKKALKIAHSSDASHLPGWIGQILEMFKPIK